MITVGNVLSFDQWRRTSAAHRAELEPIVLPYLEKRSKGCRDPVLDFLFEYYAFRPSALLRWSPGLDVALSGDPADLGIDQRYLGIDEERFSISASSFPEKRTAGLKWAIDLLTGTSLRPPSFGCHGLHEWAMVYETTDLRHRQLPLRLGQKGTNDVVRSSKLLCSHFDAFRFFSPSATGRNNVVLSRQSMLESEQPGCLHTNMDLYKWASKFYPWVSSDVIRTAFLLARKVRIVDMRASPYDLSDLGLEPIRIENETGRQEYRQHQARFASEAAPLRLIVIDALTRLQSSVAQLERSTQSLANDIECSSADN